MFVIMMLAAAITAQNGPAGEQATPPHLRNLDRLTTYQDYPMESLRAGEAGIVSLVLHVSADGKITSCDVTESSGFERLDTTTCSLVKSRAKFDPGKDAVGAAIAGEYRLAKSWGVGDNQPRATINLSLELASVPQGYRAPAKALLTFKADGRVSACEITSTSGSNSFDQTTCIYLSQQQTIAAPKSKSTDIPATAVRYVTANLSNSSNKISHQK